MAAILITGGAGFIGSNLVRRALERFPDQDIVTFDNLTYAGNLDNLADLVKNPRYHFFKGDVADKKHIEGIFALDIEAVLHLAAESHVDRSITDATPFIRTNVLGTQTLLDAALRKGVKKFVQVSTDEVYGSLGAEGSFTETTPLAPNSPYSASKASADLLVRAAYHTHKLPVCTTRCSNNYGPFQFPEKLLPVVITKALMNQNIPVYGDGMNVRDWLFVEDHCDAILDVAEKGVPGEVYNIGGNCEVPNLDLVKTVLSILRKPESLITFVKDRPGHDRRYAIDSSKIQRELGWTPKHTFENALKTTIDWYVSNEEWLRRVKSGEYRATTGTSPQPL